MTSQQNAENVVAPKPLDDERNVRVMTCGNTKYLPSGIQQNVDGWVRRIDFEPGYDCIHDYPKCHQTMGGGRHGRHGMNLRFLLGTEEGVVQFLMCASDWLPGSIQHGSTNRDLPLHGAMAADLGHHWTRPVYEGQDGGGACEYLYGAKCYYDGSGLNADPILERFFREGLDGVWRELEKYHTYCSESAAATAQHFGRDVSAK
jgi:hypothetical protein